MSLYPKRLLGKGLKKIKSAKIGSAGKIEALLCAPKLVENLRA